MWREKVALLEARFTVRIMGTNEEKHHLVCKVNKLMREDNLNEHELGKLGFCEESEAKEADD